MGEISLKTISTLKGKLSPISVQSSTNLPPVSEYDAEGDQGEHQEPPGTGGDHQQIQALRGGV